MLMMASLVFADSTSDFEFYRSIPQYESISLGGQNISIVVKSNYTISMSASDRSNSYTKSELIGSGSVMWDANEKRLYLQLNGRISGSYSRDEDVYTTKKEYNVGSTLMNGLFGSGTADYYTYKKEYDHTEYYRASGSDNFSVKIPMSISSDKRYYTLSGRTFSARLTGNTSCTVSFSINGEQNTLNYGDSKAAGNSSTDEFGAWDWTSDRSKIFLNSTNMQNNQLCIVRNSQDGTFKLYLYFGGIKIDGTSASDTNDGRLIKLNFSFEDGTNTSLQFFEQSNYWYSYATYNRFLEEWNMDATSIINQIKGKQMAIVSYTNNGTNYSAIFELEGLEAIMSYF